MARALLPIVKSPENILAMTREELAYALLEDMQARLASPINGMANREHVGENLFAVGTFHSSNGAVVRDLANRINKAGRDAFALLERWDLVEPADDMNGRNGYIVLTDKGKSTTERTDFERIRVRGFLQEEMLHPLLRGQIYGYSTADDLGTAVFEAFKTVEIEVRKAGGYAEKEIGKSLMCKAFASADRWRNQAMIKPTAMPWLDCSPARCIDSEILERIRDVRLTTCSKQWKS